MGCTSECIKKQKRYEQINNKFNEDHPNHCLVCNGWGGYYSSYDPSPAGVTLSSGCFEDFEECSDCIGDNKCPHCQNPIKEKIDGLQCTVCNWTDKSEGRITEPECLCWMDDEEWELSEELDLFS